MKIELFLIDAEDNVLDSVELEGDDDDMKGLYAELKAIALADTEEVEDEDIGEGEGEAGAAKR